jgi:hypothetical protein
MKTSEKNMFPLIRKHFSSVLSNELRNVEKKSKSEKLQTKKVEKSLIFHVFWCFVRYEIFTKDMKTSEKNMFPLLRKHFSSVLSND